MNPMRAMLAILILASALVAAPAAQAAPTADATASCLVDDGALHVHCFNPDHSYCVIRYDHPVLGFHFCPG